MKLFFSLLISINLYANENVHVFYSPSNFDRLTIKNVIETLTNIPESFIEYHQCINECKNEIKGLMSILIDKKQNDLDIEVEIFNTDWEFWKRNRKYYFKEKV